VLAVYQKLVNPLITLRYLVCPIAYAIMKRGAELRVIDEYPYSSVSVM